MQRYSVSGFSHELGFRPFHFAEPIPAVRICAVCGLLPQTTTSLQCRHVLCKTCYSQCLVNGICECPLDGDKFLVKHAEWKIFPMKNLLRHKVKCWNEGNGCDAVVTTSDMLKHFDRLQFCEKRKTSEAYQRYRENMKRNFDHRHNTRIPQIQVNDLVLVRKGLPGTKQVNMGPYRVVQIAVQHDVLEDNLP
ncbi:uncharacterized protein LOC142769299 isoform X2 [Rhipicephalus microplus]|uniref:uncharacterized protein LOC142769299 isoform X2 n=1 Tax=Rhipicephalus microplus TaxID=6941 RepID=UPI003F6A8C54